MRHARSSHPASGRPSLAGWLAGRHAVAALACAVIMLVAPPMLVLFQEGEPLTAPIYRAYICIPNADAPWFGENGIQTLCPRGSQSTLLIVPLAELCYAGFAIAAIALLAPLMSSWERLNPWRMRPRALASAITLLAVPFACGYALSDAVSSPSTISPLSLVIVNAMIDVGLWLLGMALLGTYYGMGLGLVAVILNMACQGKQTMALHCALRVYPDEVASLLSGQHLLPVITVLLLLAALCLWSWTGGRGVIHFADR